MQDLPVGASALNSMPDQQGPRDEQLQQVVRKLAHDLRTPLSILSMGIEAVRMTHPDPAQCDALCDMMAKEGIESMKRIIEEAVERTG